MDVICHSLYVLRDFWSYLASFHHLNLMIWPFSYQSRSHLFLYCPVQHRLGKVELSAIKHSGKKGLMIIKQSSWCNPVLTWNFGPENGSFDRDFKDFSNLASTVPQNNCLWRAFLVKYHTFYLIGASNYDVQIAL